MNILSHLAVGEQFLGTKLFRPLERKIILKGKLASYSSHEELLAFLGLLAISIGTNKHEQALGLAGISKAGPRSTPVFWNSFY